jgi:hypothetical protein
MLSSHLMYVYIFYFFNNNSYNVGNYRRQISGADQSADFFHATNTDAMAARQEAAQQAMVALKEFISGGNEIGRVGIFDATNTTKKRRKWIMKELKDVVHSKSHVVFVEIICTDESVIENNIRAVKTSMPDYKGKNENDAVADFRQRIDNYNSVYETIKDDSLSFIKLFDEGKKMTANNIRGSLQSKCC